MDVRRSHIGGVATPPGFAKPVAGCPHQRGATYQSYLEVRVGGEGVHTYLIKTRILEIAASASTDNESGKIDARKVDRSQNAVKTRNCGLPGIAPSAISLLFFERDINE